MDFSSAPKIAQAFHRAIVARWPDFAAYASHDGGGDLAFQVPRNSPDEGGRPLCLVATADVDLDEAIVAFGAGHSHGGDWKSPTDPDFQFRGSVRLIEDILSERVVGISTEAGGGGLETKERVDTRDDVAQVRSWLGTHDRGV